MLEVLTMLQVLTTLQELTKLHLSKRTEKNREEQKKNNMHKCSKSLYTGINDQHLFEHRHPSKNEGSNRKVRIFVASFNIFGIMRFLGTQTLF